MPVVQPGLRIPATWAPARAAARVQAPGGWPGLPLPLVEGERGSLLLGQPLPRRGRLGRQVFGRRRLLLNAAQRACHAAPAGARSARTLLYTHGEAWEKSLWLKGDPARLQKPAGSRGNLASMNCSGKVLCGVQNLSAVTLWRGSVHVVHTDVRGWTRGPASAEEGACLPALGRLTRGRAPGQA